MQSYALIPYNVVLKDTLSLSGLASEVFGILLKNESGARTYDCRYSRYSKSGQLLTRTLITTSQRRSNQQYVEKVEGRVNELLGP